MYNPKKYNILPKSQASDRKIRQRDFFCQTAPIILSDGSGRFIGAV